MKSIVTGGAGFIGSHLSERLVSLGHKVIIIDNFSIGKKSNIKSIKSKVKIVDLDIRNYNSIYKYFKNVDNVFHLAALADIVPSIENPSSYFSSNVQGTFNVLKASQENKVKDFYTQLPRPVMEYQKIIQLLKMKKFLQNIHMH